ncbi:SMI1/KNR4 family protein [Aliikangiella sp. IMCC44359]|uniref:SMI1/KNR4 family protein n=1 Tax=Aliikangiella sp. IMCC44359 TaxID=3459125 RepID=UPI00403AC4A1
MITYDEKHKVLDYEEEAKKFFNSIGYKVPEEYLDFLKENGTGLFPEPGLYDGLMEVGVFYSFSIENDLDDIHNIINVNKELQANQRISNNIVAFAETADSHNIFCLVLNGPLEGKVLLLGDDNLVLMNEYTASDLDEKEDVIDGSFSEFVSKLG